MEYYHFPNLPSSSFRKRSTSDLVRTYGGDREICRDVATLRMLMSWTPRSAIRYIIRYANRAQDGGVRLYIRRVYKSINQSGFQQDFVISPRGKRHLGEI